MAAGAPAILPPRLAGASEEACLRDGLWSLFRFSAPAHAAQMPYAHAAMQERKPFALGVQAGGPGSEESRALLLDFKPATNDHLGSRIPHITIPNFLTMGGCALARCRHRLWPPRGAAQP